jgi:hypothetical protein
MESINNLNFGADKTVKRLKIGLSCAVLAALSASPAMAENVQEKASRILLTGDMKFPLTRNNPFQTNTRKTICRDYNTVVKYINGQIKANNLDVSYLDDNACTFIRISNGHIINNDEEFISRSGITELRELVDLKQTIDIVILSQPEETQYMLFLDGYASLVEQKIKMFNRDPTIYTGKKRSISFSNGYGSEKYIGGVFNNFDVSISVSPPWWLIFRDFQTWHDNERYWTLADYSPKTDAEFGKLNKTDTTSVSYTLGFSGPPNPLSPLKGNISLGWSWTKGKTISRDLKAMNVSSDINRGETGFKSTYWLDPEFLWELPDINNFYNSPSQHKSDKYVGPDSWRHLDFSSNARWVEDVNSDNCEEGTTKRINFSTIVSPERGIYTLNSKRELDDHYNTGLRGTKDKVSSDRQEFANNIVVNTVCKLDANGKHMRVVSGTGFL